MLQWKEYLQQHLDHAEIPYQVTNNGDELDIKVNSLAYLSWLRSKSHASVGLDESRDNVAWLMLNKQLRAFADKADRGVLKLASRLHMNEEQIIIRLDFCYDPEQHIVYVS
ncbi:hypothetical protein OA79_05855 [Marinomonas sp. TW1]|nr:hypothetical protein OA79_05855 [Marinomonas sp. TW1]